MACGDRPGFRIMAPARGNPDHARAYRIDDMAAAENSFDIVSTVDLQEVRNAVQQAEKEIGNRYDLKKAAAELKLEGEEMTARGVGRVHAPAGARRPAVEAGQARRPPQVAALRQDRGGEPRPGAAEDHPPAGHPHGDGQEDRRRDQGEEAQGAGRHPGGHRARLRARTATTCRRSSPCSRGWTSTFRSPSPITAPNKLSDRLENTSFQTHLAFRPALLWPARPAGGRLPAPPPPRPATTRGSASRSPASSPTPRGSRSTDIRVVLEVSPDLLQHAGAAADGRPGRAAGERHHGRPRQLHDRVALGQLLQSLRAGGRRAGARLEKGDRRDGARSWRARTSPAGCDAGTPAVVARHGRRTGSSSTISASSWPRSRPTTAQGLPGDGQARPHPQRPVSGPSRDLLVVLREPAGSTVSATGTWSRSPPSIRSTAFELPPGHLGNKKRTDPVPNQPLAESPGGTAPP